ncbi:MAG: hypothetical protein ACTHMY_22860 [Solirubrobacteraceae bacterium]
MERTNYFIVEAYGPQASLCGERLAKGSRVDDGARRARAAFGD